MFLSKGRKMFLSRYLVQVLELLCLLCTVTDLTDEGP